MPFPPVFIPLTPVFILNKKPMIRSPQRKQGHPFTGPKDKTMSVFEMKLTHDQAGRIVEKTEIIAG
jgi:hypothetical protein